MYPLLKIPLTIHHALITRYILFPFFHNQLYPLNDILRTNPEVSVTVVRAPSISKRHPILEPRIHQHPKGISHSSFALMDKFLARASLSLSWKVRCGCCYYTSSGAARFFFSYTFCVCARERTQATPRAAWRPARGDKWSHSYAAP